MLDDLKHRRHFVRKFGEINKDYMKTLLSSIKETDFMKLEEEPPSPSADGVDETRFPDGQLWTLPEQLRCATIIRKALLKRLKWRWTVSPRITD